jgi:hypothetical protein
MYACMYACMYVYTHINGYRYGRGLGDCEG